MNTELIERLNRNAKRKCWILFNRPQKPKDHDKPYKWDSVFHTDETKYWKHINRLINAKWEYRTVEVDIPLDLLETNDKYVFKQ